MWERLDSAQLKSDGTNRNNLKEKGFKIQKEKICGHMSTNPSSTCHKNRTMSTCCLNKRSDHIWSLYICICCYHVSNRCLWFITSSERFPRLVIR